MKRNPLVSMIAAIAVLCCLASNPSSGQVFSCEAWPQYPNNPGGHSFLVVCPGGDGGRIKMILSPLGTICVPPPNSEARLYLTGVTLGCLHLCPGFANPVIAYFDSLGVVEFNICGSVLGPCQVHREVTCMGVVLLDSDMTFKSYDLNSDGVVGIPDFAILSSDWQQASGRSDFNGDGVVNQADFALLVAHWGHGCGNPGP